MTNTADAQVESKEHSRGSRGENNLLSAVVLPVVFLLALFLPRLVMLDTFFVQDEYLWLNRSLLYVDAFAEGEWAAMIRYPPFGAHPGTTFMTAAGPVLVEYRASRGLPQSFEEWSPDDQRRAAAWGRATTGVLTGFLLLAVFFTLRRLRMFSSSPGWAAVTTLLLAWEPWVLGISRVAHLDSILALFLVLAIATSVLAREQRTAKHAVLAGAWWGLAFLTKVPALLALPFVLIPFFLRPPTQWRQIARDLLFWSAGALTAIVVTWPPMWVDPVKTIVYVLRRAFFHVENPEPYFWPGMHPPFFFFTLSAVAAVGCAVYIVLRAWQMRNRPRDDTFLVFDLFLLAGLFFGGYLVYAQGDHARKNVPALALLAAAGAGGWFLLTRHLPAARRFLAPALLALHAALVLAWFPHLPSFHTPLFSSSDGKRLLVDNGNGIRLVADYFNAHEDSAVIGTNLPTLLIPYLRPELRSRVTRLPESGQLSEVDDRVTYIVVPESVPARVLFDPAAKKLTADLVGKTPEAVLRVRDVPLYAIYRLR